MGIKFTTKEEFIEGKIFKEKTDQIQNILLSLFDMLDKGEVDYVIKVRDTKSIVIAVKGSENKNIVTVTIYNEHLRLLIYKVGSFNIYKNDDINESLKNKIINKYYEINKEKKQISIYLDEELVSSVTRKAKENNQRLNEFVVDAINAKVNTVFLNDNHKKEFSILLKDSGLYSKDKYIYRLPEEIRNRVALFYLVSPYEYHNDDDHSNGIKFTCNKETKKIQGPAEVIENWYESLYFSPMMAAYGIAEIFTDKQNFHLLESILMEGYEDINILFDNVIKLLNGYYTIQNDDIVRTKMKKINMSGAFKF